MKTAERPPIVRPAEDSLTVLAKRANAKHAACLKNNEDALHRAHETGKALVEAKAQVHREHGHEWLKWVERNLNFDRNRAAEYIRVADNWEWIEAECTKCGHIGLREALNLIAGERAAPQLEACEDAPCDRPTATGENLTEEEAEEALALLGGESLADCAPEEQRTRIEEERAAHTEALDRQDRREHTDDRTRRLNRAGNKVAGVRRDLLGLGHEADDVVADLDRIAEKIADLKEG